MDGQTDMKKLIEEYMKMFFVVAPRMVQLSVIFKCINSLFNEIIRNVDCVTSND
jgi:hypothetical protein